ncbi:MAG: hypothetical protein EZS28_022578 [Streblomastix strix]|uniref:Major facilitator superfamily (MFS) profile domain-containing protein n=1 Tax=Streblomastix strix TaxID=222440 RepID=A0A5J4VH01_9EUKA|nr:MAG: hypothetical protein EZS28_022578 [Streblomastix strix]
MLNYFTSTAQFAGFQTLLPPICLDRYQYPAKMIGFITMCFGIGMAIVQLILFPIIVSRVGERRPLVFGAIFASIMMSLIALIHSKIMLWIFSLFFGIGQAFVVPTSTSIFSYFGSGKIKGTVLSMGQCISVAARAIAPVTLSWLYDINEQLPFYVVSGLTVVGASDSDSDGGFDVYDLETEY